jgi:hypothetical protein
MKPEPIYRAIMLECERQRLSRGLPMERFSEFAGLPERYYPKALWADQPSGRQAQWGTLQIIIDALFPDGYDLIIKPRIGPEIDAHALRYKTRYAVAPTNSKTQRELMSELGKKGAEARNKKLSPWQRKRIAQRAGKARARRAKLAAVSARQDEIPVMA